MLFKEFFDHVGQCQLIKTRINMLNSKLYCHVINISRMPKCFSFRFIFM